MPHDFKKADEAFRLAKSSEDGTISPAGGSLPKGFDPPNEVLTERVSWRPPVKRSKKGGQ